MVTGIISEKLGKRPFWNLIAMIAGSVVVFAMGVSWLKTITGMDWNNAFMVGIFPFIPGDIVKIAAGTFSAKIIRPVTGIQ